MGPCRKNRPKSGLFAKTTPACPSQGNGEGGGRAAGRQVGEFEGAAVGAGGFGGHIQAKAVVLLATWVDRAESSVNRRSHPCSSAAGENPGPSSVTRMVSAFPNSAHAMPTRLRACSAAFDTRFIAARRRATRSRGASGRGLMAFSMSMSASMPRACAVARTSRAICSQRSAGRIGSLEASPVPRDASISRRI